jgi:uncharacterized protein YqjF (DUF2071 family)
MKMTLRASVVNYRTRRRVAPTAALRVEYHPTGGVRHAQPGDLDYFLSERYCLYAVRSGRAYRTDIHHLPWPLQSAEAEIQRNSLLEAAGVQGSPAPLLTASRFARKLNVLAWAPERC